MNLLFVISIFWGICFGILDSLSSSILIIISFLCNTIACSTIRNHTTKVKAYKLATIVSCVYFISAYINSLNFDNTKFFLVLDPTTYFPFLNLTAPNTDFVEYIKSCYFELSDSNALHEVYVRYASIIANNYFDGATVLFQTLLHTIFGVLASLTLFRILSRYFDSSKSFRYALVFALCSPFFYYSTVVIRDIIIAYFYIRGFEIILEKFSVKGIVQLIILMLLTWGCRLYSGFFYSLLILYYLYINFKTTIYGKFVLFLMILIGSTVIISGGLSSAVEQSQNELLVYQELDSERGAEIGGGLSYKLLSLPTGIKEIALFFYSQMFPFPFYSGLTTFGNIEQFYAGLMFSIYPLFWFLIFYQLLLYLIWFKEYKHLNNNLLILLFIAYAFIILNTAHIDPRRIMPMYPLLYLIFLYVRENFVSRKKAYQARRLLLSSYFILIVAYLFVKFV